jgi:hypothetical protein
MTSAKKHKLTSDLSRDITFTGEELANIRRETGTGTFTRMQVFKTSGGNYACSKVYETQWQGCSDKHLAKICRTEEEVIEFYGLGDQAKDLYALLKIDCSITEDEYLKNGNPSQEHQDLNEFGEYQ